MKKVKKVYKSITNYPFKIKDKLTNKAVNRFKKYALDKFIKSEYLRNSTNILPLTVITTIIRVIINFLLISRIKSGMYYLDFTISIICTILLSLLTPLFYDTISYLWENDVLAFTNLVVDSLWDVDGAHFFEIWKSRILGSITVSVIIILFFIEVTSRTIQEFLVHMMITGFITDKLNNYFLDLLEKKNNEEIEKSPLSTKIIQFPSDIEIVDQYNPNDKLYTVIDEYITLENGTYSSDSYEKDKDV